MQLKSQSKILKIIYLILIVSLIYTVYFLLINKQQDVIRNKFDDNISFKYSRSIISDNSGYYFILPGKYNLKEEFLESEDGHYRSNIIINSKDVTIYIDNIANNPQSEKIHYDKYSFLGDPEKKIGANLIRYPEQFEKDKYRLAGEIEGEMVYINKEPHIDENGHYNYRLVNEFEKDHISYLMTILGHNNLPDWISISIRINNSVYKEDLEQTLQEAISIILSIKPVKPAI